MTYLLIRIKAITGMTVMVDKTKNPPHQARSISASYLMRRIILLYSLFHDDRHAGFEPELQKEHCNFDSKLIKDGIIMKNKLFDLAAKQRLVRAISPCISPYIMLK